MAITGTVLAVIGVTIEGIGAAAMVYYPLRRRLPSPFLLFAIGFALFLLGAALTAMGLTAFAESP